MAFGPAGREFEQVNFQKFECQGWGGGGGGSGECPTRGVLKFRIDQCIIWN